MTTPTTFKDAYAILKANADHLEHSPQLDIDNLINLVDESIHAYKICQDRLNTIEQALERAFNDSLDNNNNVETL